MNTTFHTHKENGILTVNFNNPPVNIQDMTMLEELNDLISSLELDNEIKVVVFQSDNPEIFIAHADIGFLKDMSTTPVLMENIELSQLQRVLDRITRLPQATIAKIEGYCRGGGNEFALACDMRFADVDKAIFMQMEVGMGILPCGGGASRMARQMGLGRALEIILSARDFNAKEAEEYGMINKAFKKEELDEYVNMLANRIEKFPLASIQACKVTVQKSIDLPIEEALKLEAYWLYQALSKTPAIKRFTEAYKTGFQNNMENQRNFEQALIDLQDIQ